MCDLQACPECFQVTINGSGSPATGDKSGYYGLSGDLYVWVWLLEIRFLLWRQQAAERYEFYFNGLWFVKKGNMEASATNTDAYWTFNKNALKADKFCISNQTVKSYRSGFLMKPQHQGNYLRTKHAQPQAALQGKRNQWQGLKPTEIIMIALFWFAGMLNV